MSWHDIFLIIAPHLMFYIQESKAKIALNKGITELKYQSYYSTSMDDYTFQTIRLQLSAYGLVKITQRNPGYYAQTFWELTDDGAQYALEHRTMKTQLSSEKIIEDEAD